jgi:hypothetical protein
MHNCSEGYRFCFNEDYINCKDHFKFINQIKYIVLRIKGDNHILVIYYKYNPNEHYETYIICLLLSTSHSIRIGPDKQIWPNN